MAAGLHLALNLTTALSPRDPEVTMAALSTIINVTLLPSISHDQVIVAVSGPGGQPIVRPHETRGGASWAGSPSAWSPVPGPAWSPVPDGAGLTLQVLHTVLTVAALVVNCTTLGVMYGLVTRLTPPLQLLTSLAFSDMLAPWAVMTAYFPHSSCQDEIHTALLLTSHNASMLTLLGLALVHNIATFRPLNYTKIVTQKRLWITINLIWMAAMAGAHVHFLAVLTHPDPGLSFCTQVLHNTRLALCMSAALLCTMAVVSGLVYARILLHLQRGGVPGRAPGGARRSTRGVVTGVVMASCCLLVWLPYLVTKFVQTGPDLPTGLLVELGVCQVCVLLLATANPLTYSVRMSAMQAGYLTLYHKARAGARIAWRRVAGRARRHEVPSTPLSPIESIC